MHLSVLQVCLGIMTVLTYKYNNPVQNATLHVPTCWMFSPSPVRQPSFIIFGTKHCDQVVSTPVSYFGDPVFKPQSRDWLSWEVSVVFRQVWVVQIWVNYLAHEQPLRAACNSHGRSLGHAMLKTFISGFISGYIAIQVIQSSS
jgi:hypothetical protein